MKVWSHIWRQEFALVQSRRGVRRPGVARSGRRDRDAYYAAATHRLSINSYRIRNEHYNLRSRDALGADFD